MGVNEIYMGKGIIVPVRVFVKHFLKEINEIYTENIVYEHEIVEKIVKKYIGDYKICTLGHDAFMGRHGLIFDMFEDTPNERSANRIGALMSNKQYDENDENDENDEKLPFDSLGCSDLMFIGYFINIGPSELSYYIKAPEVIYSLAACIPLIIKHYPILLSKDCSSLNIFNQEACIWTFASDCCCCG
jgi:hypothetical protein